MIDWKEDEYGWTAVIAGWIRLAVNASPGHKWVCSIDGVYVTEAEAGRSPIPAVFSDADAAKNAVTDRTRKVVLEAAAALGMERLVA